MEFDFKLGGSRQRLEIFTKPAKQQATVSVGLLEWREVNSVEHSGSVWGPMFSNVFIVDLDECMDSPLVKAAEGVKVFHLVNT